MIGALTSSLWGSRMSIQAQPSDDVSFGEFRLNLKTAELWRDGTKIVLPGKPFQVLVMLMGRPGQLVSREELKKQLWPSDTFVDFDVSLNKAVNRLREALGDSAERPIFIETLPRKGYRFVGPVAHGAEHGLGTSDRPSTEGLASDPVALVDVATSRKASSDDPIPARRLSRLEGAAVALIALAGVCAFIVTRNLTTHSAVVPAYRIAKMTANGLAREVAVSPDGRYVVYSVGAGDGESLRLRQVDTSSEIEIFPAGPGFHGLTFTPDGVYVYFVRSDPNDPYFKYLYAVPALGGAARRLIADVDSPVSFSPDGSQIVFERAAVARNVIELRVARADGRDERVLATVPNGDAGLFQPGPSWSRDGRTVICPFRLLERQVHWIMVSVSVRDGTVREIYSDVAALGRPGWLNGHTLLVPRYDAEYERWQLWTLSYPDGTARRFTNDLSDYDDSLDIARDRPVAVTVASTLVSDIWEAPSADPSEAQRVTFGELPILAVATHPDGRLFASGNDGRIWVVRPNGQRAPLPDLHHAGWFAMCNGIIFFTSFEASAVTLRRANADGSHALTLFSGDVAYPGCSPDGTFVYFVNRHRPQTIWRVSSKGGPPEPVHSGLGEGIASFLSVSPDGQRLSCAFIQTEPRGWRVAVLPAGGGPTIETFDVPGGTRRLYWSRAGTSLQYLVTHDGVTNVWEHALGAGRSVQLTRFTAGRIFDFAWSPDHSRLVFTRGDVSSDVVLLSNIQ